MLTLPKIVERKAEPYVAIREKVTLPFDASVDRILGELFGALGEQNIAAAGPVFFKHNVIAMPDLDMDFGVAVAAGSTGTGQLVNGVLPAGRYAEIEYFGHYDGLMEVNTVLIGWAKLKGIVWDVEEKADGDHFACRLEIYHNGPNDEPDPAKWHTSVTIKIKD